MATGTVKWFDEKKGFGFIDLDSGESVFVHHTAIKGNGFKTLEENQKVEFTIEKGDKGDKAKDVVII